jgi:putative flippase GtrA
MHKFKIEVTKFTLVGAANFALTFVVFTTMLKVLMVNYLISLATQWVVGMLFSYVLNFTWVFKPEQKIQFRARFVRFFLASALSISLNMLALRYMVERTNFDPFYVQFALMPFIVIFNFLTAKFWSLKAPSLSRSPVSSTPSPSAARRRRKRRR